MASAPSVRIRKWLRLLPKMVVMNPAPLSLGWASSVNRRQRSVSSASKKQHWWKFFAFAEFLLFGEGTGAGSKRSLIQRVTAFGLAKVPPLRRPTEPIASGDAIRISE